MCRLKSWDAEWTKGVALLIENILLDPKTTLGFSLHLTELYMEELAKVSFENRHELPQSVNVFFQTSLSGNVGPACY